MKTAQVKNIVNSVKLYTVACNLNQGLVFKTAGVKLIWG